MENVDCISMLKILARCNVKAICQKNSVEIEGEVPYEVLKKIFENKGILSIQNFKGEFKGEKSSYSKAVPKTMEIKRGDIYLCNFGSPTGFETGFERPVLVLQNTDSLEETKTAIVVPCSSNVNFLLNDTIVANFSEKTVDNCSELLKKYERSSIYLHEIRAVDKSRLERYLGTAKKSLMDEIETKVKYSIGLMSYSNEEITVPDEEQEENEISEVSDLNDEQVELVVEKKNSNLTEITDSEKNEFYEFTITEVLGKLSSTQRTFVKKFNTQELFEIINSTDYAQNKIDAILKLFEFETKAFDMRSLILLAPSKIYSIEELIGKLPNIDKRKARTLKKNLVLEVKEKTGMSPISFVEMIKKLLEKGES